ncbi:hypothetical protein ACFWUQ_09660 [Streptomyces sp. NPDC058662]|uniref:hypothetical protein n=1 Tax=Streptomyces sp. NPDC058662 TaxID=3346583 RepID=UPI0036505DFD
MHARTRVGLGLLAATLSLTMTACGGDAQPAANDNIPGVDGTSSASTSPTAPAPAGAERPKITLPADVKNVFEGAQTGDPKKDEVLADDARRVDAVSDAILKGDPSAPALRVYEKDQVLVDTGQWVRSFVEAGMSFTGTTRYFDRRVNLVDDKTATLVYCADETKAVNTDRKTGKPHKEQSQGKDHFVLYNYRLVKSENGVWQSVTGFSERGAASCTK